MSYNITTLVTGAALKAWTAFREGRLPMSPAWWLRALAQHWREEGARAGTSPPCLPEPARLDESYADWLRERAADEVPSPLTAPALTLVALIGDPHDVDDLMRFVQLQAFARWELWFLHEDGDPIAHGQRQRHGGRDQRVRWQSFDRASPDAWLPPGDGGYIVFLGPRTVLAPDALAHVAAAAHDTAADWIYTDDDLLDPTGRRTDPSLKGAFSPELALVDDYATRLAVASREAVRKCGGLRRHFGNAQIYDLLLRIVEQHGRVHHLATVCCHRRLTVPAVLTAEHHRAAEQFMARRVAPATIVAEMSTARAPFSTQRVKWSGGAPSALGTTIVIPTRDRLDLLRPCVESIIRTVDPEGRRC